MRAPKAFKVRPPFAAALPSWVAPQSDMTDAVETHSFLAMTLFKEIVLGHVGAR